MYIYMYVCIYVYIHVYIYICKPLYILTWSIPWTEEPGELESIGSQRVGHS